MIRPPQKNIKNKKKSIKHTNICDRPGGEAIEVRPELVLESGKIGLFDGRFLEAADDFLVAFQLVALLPPRICESAAAALIAFDRHSKTREIEIERGMKEIRCFFFFFFWEIQRK